MGDASSQLWILKEYCKRRKAYTIKLEIVVVVFFTVSHFVTKTEMAPQYMPVCL